MKFDLSKERKASKEEPKVETPLVVETAPTPILINSAFSVYKDGNTGMWTVAKISFDATTNQVGGIEILSQDLDRTSANERFKINVAKALLG